ncbi:MAG: NBR1-Ig-like domain-containing protein [Anaerolineales bacterium]
MSKNIRSTYTRFILPAGLAVLLMLTAACIRSATNTEEELASVATEKAIQTADAEIQQTLEALLGSATVAAPTATLQATATPGMAEATESLESVQLTQLAAAMTEDAATPTAGPMEEGTPLPTSTPAATSTACYGARYVFDETYPDGTRVDAGQAIQKTWRLQNVGSCNWVGSEYELVFISGDRMGGQSPLAVTITVLAGNYANFSINMKAPAEPGTYRGEWMLRTEGGDVFGVGPNFDLPIWIEIIVRG